MYTCIRPVYVYIYIYRINITGSDGYSYVYSPCRGYACPNAGSPTEDSAVKFLAVALPRRTTHVYLASETCTLCGKVMYCQIT